MTVNDLVRIAAVGGGLDLRGMHVSVNDLVRIAGVANGRGRLKISMSGLTVDDCVRIASVGKGSVFFCKD